MQIFSPIKYLRRLSISQKFYTLIGIVAFILALELASFWFALNTLSSIRAYVGGEGLWSKSQKESLNSLLSYTDSFDQSDFDKFLSHLKVPLGDNQARLALEKPDANLAAARQGFLDGNNNSADIDGMIFLFQHFRRISYLQKAISIWTQADVQIQTQIALGLQIHAIIASSTNPSDYATSEAIKPLRAQLLDNDNTLTPLENQFSETLGEASRWVGNVLFYAILILTLILACGGLMIALFILRLVTQLDDAKSEFVALASHQLRSPLNVINLSIENLKRFGPPRSIEEKNAVEGMSREVEQMASLIDAILDISRIELGALAIEPQEIDVVAAAKAEVAALAVIAQSKGLLIEQSYDSGELQAFMDPRLLQMIFQNLLSNAIKYTSRGGQVSLTVEHQLSRILICVADTGCGIPKAQQKNIFSKLFRATNANKLDPQGTGLGLYIVKSIVTEAGGDIWFESEEGVGTSFYVSFPSSGMKEKR